MSRRSPALLAYAGAASLAHSVAPLLLRRRARRGKEDPERLNERLGRPRLARPAGRLLWLHGASVGESLSLITIVERSLVLRPDVSVLLTAGTRTAHSLLTSRVQPSVITQYAPIDTPVAVAGFLDHWRPDLGVLVESELWPNLILGARARGARLALVSAKMSPASARGWRRAPGAARAILECFDLILARDLQETARIQALGGKPAGMMDLKFGAPPLPACEALVSRHSQLWAGRPVLLAASTHPGEESLVARAFADVKSEDPEAVLVIAPRHPERGASVAREVEALGLGCALRSRGEGGDASVLIADTLGELGAWYRLASVAVIGGSLAPGVGGHNPLEPARLECPFVAGPHHEAWPIYEELAKAGATRIIAPADLGAALAAAWRDPESLARLAAGAKTFCEARDGAVREGLDRVLALLPV